MARPSRSSALPAGAAGLLRHARRLVRLSGLVGKPPRRYARLVEEIARVRARTLVEIGTFDGRHAAAMIQAALDTGAPGAVQYLGFDLFEGMTPDILAYECSKSSVPAADLVARQLEDRFKGQAQITLFPGDSTLVLPQVLPFLPPADFVFIDGGHSLATVRSDWTCVSRLMHRDTVVIFDDYVNAEAVRHAGYGTTAVIDAIDRTRYRVQRLWPADRFHKEWGVLSTRLVRVTRRPTRLAAGGPGAGW